MELYLDHLQSQQQKFNGGKLKNIGSFGILIIFQNLKLYKRLKKGTKVYQRIYISAMPIMRSIRSGFSALLMYW